MRVLGTIADVQLSAVVTPEISRLRDSVMNVAKSGLTAVDAVRDAFGAGVAPFQKIGSGSISNYLNSFTADELGSKLIKDTARFGIVTAPGGMLNAIPKAELDSVAIVEDRHRGVLDQFTARLTISLHSVDLTRVESVRILRSYVGRAQVPRPSFTAVMETPPTNNKGADPLFSKLLRANELGVGNKVTNFVADTGGSTSRSVTSPAERRLPAVLPTLNTNKPEEFVSTGLVSMAGVDRSVVENITFYLNRRSLGDLPEPARPPLTVGSRSGINVLHGSRVSSVGNILPSSNGLEFSPIGTVTPHGSSVRQVGDITEITFVDPSVVFGAIYTYFVVAVGLNGEVGPRSRMVEVTVSRTVPPARPVVTYGLTAGQPRFSIKCSPGSSHVEVFRSGRAALISSMMGSDESLIIEGPSNKVGEFYHTGDLGLGPDGSTTFIDHDVIPGDRPTYRFYSVDPYGLKSQTPFSCSMMIPSHGERLPLSIPSITTEQVSSGQGVIRVSVTCDDDRVMAFNFSRRDITANERAVHQANQPEYFTLGRVDGKRAGSRRGPMPLDTPWPSVLMASAGSASFIDTTVRLDRVYQYAVQAIDRRGNKSFMVGAQPVGVYSKPPIDSPTDLTAKLLVEEGLPRGVMLTWTPGTVDVSPNQLLDDQDVLAATSIRTVFQVERRQKGAPFWDSMPATSESYFVDPAIESQTPSSRPPYVIKGLEYEYRVLSMQSGGFISPRTDSIRVTVTPTPPAPSTIWVRSSDPAIRPLVVVVSWDMDSKFVDHWEVQRATANKIYAARVSSMDSTLARELQYDTVANIPPESSRATGLQTDSVITLDPTVYVGRRFYIDSDVDLANSHFYRVRSVGQLGVVSDWTYGGVSVTDYTFDRKLLSTLSDDEKVMLTTDARPIKMRFKL